MLLLGRGDRRHLECRRQVNRRLDARQFGADLARLGRTAGSKASPERDHLLGGGFAAPRCVQERLRERPQVHRVGAAPRERLAWQRNGRALGEQLVGATLGYAGHRRVDRAKLRPTLRRIEELSRDAAQRVVGACQVVAANGNDRRRTGGRCRGRGLADCHHVTTRRIDIRRRFRDLSFRGSAIGPGFLIDGDRLGSLLVRVVFQGSRRHPQIGNILIERSRRHLRVGNILIERSRRHLEVSDPFILRSRRHLNVVSICHALIQHSRRHLNVVNVVARCRLGRLGSFIPLHVGLGGPGVLLSGEAVLRVFRTPMHPSGLRIGEVAVFGRFRLPDLRRLFRRIPRFLEALRQLDAGIACFIRLLDGVRIVVVTR